MRSKPCPPRPELDALLAKAKEWMEKASPEEIEAMLRKQCEGYVKAEMSWPKDCPYR